MNICQVRSFYMLGEAGRNLIKQDKCLIVRQGVETVKPDVHLTRFIYSVVNNDFSEQELVDVLENVTNRLDLKAFELDWRIWIKTDD